MSQNRTIKTGGDAWVCPQCQAANPIGARFCKQCGQVLACECPQCDELIEIIATFCGACGFELQGYTPPLGLHTELTAVDNKLATRIDKELDKAVFSDWARASLIQNEQVSATVKRGLVISLGMVKTGSREQFSLSLCSEQPSQVQISSNSPWLTVNKTSLALKAEQAQTVRVTVNTSGLQGGEYYLGEIKIANSQDGSVAAVHYVMLGTKKFLGAGDAKSNLKSQLPRYLESYVLGPALVEGMLQQARQSLTEGDSATSAAAYAHAVRFLTNQHTDPDLAPSQLITSSPRAAALAQRWHRIASSLLEHESRTPGLDWLNWDPQVSLGKRISFHLLPLWQFADEPGATSQTTSSSQKRILYTLNASLAVDALTGELVKTSQPVLPLPVVGAGTAFHRGQNMAADGEFVVQIDGKDLVAKQGERILWESKLGRFLDAYGQVVMGRHHVYFYDGDKILAFVRNSGKQVWKQDFKRYEAYNPPQFVEVNGYLLALYVALGSAGRGASYRYDHYQYFEWWNAATGERQKQQFPIGRGNDDGKIDELNVCYAVAPIIPEPFSQRPELQPVFARVVVAYDRSLYEFLLFRHESSTGFYHGWGGGSWSPDRKGMYMKWEQSGVIPSSTQILYMHMLGDYTCLVFSRGGVGSGKGPAQLTVIDTRYSQNQQSRFVTLQSRFTKEELEMFRRGTDLEKRNLLFDMIAVGGVLILRSKTKDSKVLAFV